MEKGSFHPSAGASRVQKLDEIVSQIPLPNELPKGLDFTNSPNISTSKINSSTLDSLISQNEDLMARLSVALRKTNFLDEKSSALESENSTLKHRMNAMEDKLLILQEKDRLNTGRNQNLHEEANTSRAAVVKLERMYADIYVQAQDLQRRTSLLERYRARIQKAKINLQKDARRAKVLESQLQILESSRSQFVAGFEAKLHEARTQVEEVRAKALERDHIQEERIRLENKMLFEQRQFSQSRQSSLAEVERLENDLASTRAQLKESLVFTESQRMELDRLKYEIPDLQEEVKGLRDQVESLQTLWAHKQIEFGKLEEKNRNLQNLNQAVSANLNLQRKEIQDLKLGMEREIYLKHEKIKAQQAEIEMLHQKIRELES